VHLSTDFKDRFKDSAAKLNLFKIKADLECDESISSYPTTFHANFIFNRMVALHTHIMTEKGNNLEAQVDLLARLAKNIYGGTELVYDDKAKALILLKYGLFWKAQKNFNLGLEYNHIGDRQSLDGTIYHKASAYTKIASSFSLDMASKKIGLKTAVEHELDAKTTLKSRIDNFGALDLALTSSLSDKLSATFSTGGNLSGFFSGKSSDESYSGLSFKFSL
jgi:hypothetical protein